MEKALALALLVSAALVLIEAPQARAQVFCLRQFTMANDACSLRPVVPGARRPVLPRGQLNETSVATTAAAGDQLGLQSRDRGDDEEEEEEGKSSRRSSRHHHRHYSQDEDPHDMACCSRIMGLDNSCVCNQATARLPPFMNSVRHTIKLTPIEGCEVTFDCPGPLF